MSKSFDNLKSSAVHSIEVDENSIRVVYNSNIDKEYTFNCENIDEFVSQFTDIVVGKEGDEETLSVGKFLHQQIKSGALVAQ
jgi:hypothetical protein